MKNKYILNLNKFKKKVLRPFNKPFMVTKNVNKK